MIEVGFGHARLRLVLPLNGDVNVTDSHLLAGCCLPLIRIVCQYRVLEEAAELILKIGHSKLNIVLQLSHLFGLEEIDFFRELYHLPIIFLLHLEYLLLKVAKLILDALLYDVLRFNMLLDLLKFFTGFDLLVE